MPAVPAADQSEFSSISIELAGTRPGEGQLILPPGKAIDATIRFSPRNKSHAQRAGVCNITSWNGTVWVLQESLAFAPAEMVSPGIWVLKLEMSGMEKGEYNLQVIFGGATKPAISDRLTVSD